MDTYIIKQAYHWVSSGEIEIKSDNLIYSELGSKHSGVQCLSVTNQDIIHKKCIEISKLINEIDKLNKII